MTAPTTIPATGAYYSENEPFAAQWLRNLITAGHIAAGDVDTRSIIEVKPDDLRGYTQCHFFAGLGGWSYALRLAGWSDDRAVWTGSCPCQPFSVAGKQRAGADARHLWPDFHRLIAECRPAVAFGEQVASRLGREWLGAVRVDLEALGYGVGAADLCAAGVGAPHIRQRLWWVAYADGGDASAERQQRGGEQRQQPQDGVSGVLADAYCGGSCQERGYAGEVRRIQAAERWTEDGATIFGRGSENDALADATPGGQREHGRASWEGRHAAFGDAVDGGVLADAAGSGPQGQQDRHDDLHAQQSAAERAGRDAGPWSNPEWIACRDGKARPTESGLFPLAHGAAARVGRLRATGNAIVPQVAAAFITAVMECSP